MAADFDYPLNFPNCCGALDGKRILLQAPVNSGSLYYDYKHNFSLILLALVDAQYRFLYVDVGANGRTSVGCVFGNCRLNAALEENTLHIPFDQQLPGSGLVTPFVIVADDAFSMRSYLMKPYPGRLHDDKSSRIFSYP